MAKDYLKEAIATQREIMKTSVTIATAFAAGFVAVKTNIQSPLIREVLFIASGVGFLAFSLLGLDALDKSMGLLEQLKRKDP